MLNIGQMAEARIQGQGHIIYFMMGATAHRVYVRSKEYEAILQSSRVHLLTTKYLHSLHLKIMLISLLGLPKVLIKL